EDEIAPHQRHQGLFIHPQEASASGHHQADAFVTRKRKAPRGREFQPPIEAPLGPQQAQHFCKHIHNDSCSGVLDGKYSVSSLINAGGWEHCITSTTTSPCARYFWKDGFRSLREACRGRRGGNDGNIYDLHARKDER